MIFKKVLSLMITSTLCLGLLVGCGNKDTGENSTSKGNDESFTLRISTTGEKDDNLDLAMDMFKGKYPNAEFEIISSPWNATREKQITLMSMGDIPDICKTGGWAKEFYNDGLAMNLTDVIKDWGIYNRLTPGQLERMKFGDDICAVTYNTNTMYMFYNKKLLEKLGVEVPKTIADLETLGKKIKESGTKTEDGKNVYAANISTGSVWDISTWAFSLGADFMNKDYTKTLIDSPESIAAHTKMQEFVKNGWTPIPDGTSDQLWFNGQLATYITGEWTIPATLDAKIDAGYAPAPAGSTGLSVAPIGGCDWVITEQSKNKEKAIEFLKLMYSEEFQVKADRGVTDLSIYDNTEKQKLWEKDGVLESKKVQQEQLKTAKYIAFDGLYAFPDAQNIYKAAVERILVNQEDPKTTLENAANEINKGLTK
jgi:sn-glycerol 3-phosphate transport system substrate-binding protein